MSDKRAQVPDDDDDGDDESELIITSSPPPDRVEGGVDGDLTDVTGLLNVVPTQEDEDADGTLKAAAAVVSRYSAAEAAASIALMGENEPYPPDSLTVTLNDDDNDNADPSTDNTTASPAASSSVQQIPELPRNPGSSRPVRAAVTALTVPEQYRLHPKNLDQHPPNEDSRVSAAPLSSSSPSTLRAPGAYQIAARPPGAGDQELSRNRIDDTDAEVTTLRGNNYATEDENDYDDVQVLSLDLENALEAQIVPERDLNKEVTQRMEALTVDAQTVELTNRDKSPQLRSVDGVPKSVIMIMLAVCLVALVAIGSAVGIKNRKERLSINTSQNENESANTESAPNTSPPAFLPDLEFARAIFAPLSGEDALLNELSPQYKALWWVVHEDPTQMIMRMAAAQNTEMPSSRVRLVELYVMAVLYFTTDGSHWWNQMDFLGNMTVCDWGWEGIECNEKGSVTQLYLGK
jgi:hypothetical protein